MNRNNCFFCLDSNVLDKGECNFSNCHGLTNAEGWKSFLKQRIPWVTRANSPGLSLKLSLFRRSTSEHYENLNDQGSWYLGGKDKVIDQNIMIFEAKIPKFFLNDV